MKSNHAARITTLFVIAAIGASGCMMDLGFGEDRWASDDGWYGSGQSDIEAYDGQLHGQLGTVSASGEARVYEASEGAYGASIDVRSNGAEGVLMNRLDIDGVPIADLREGTYTGGLYASAAGDPNVSVTGCSGPDDGVWEYDRGAEEVVMVVTELDADTLQIDWTATFGESVDWGTGEEIPTVETTGSVIVVR